MGAKGNEYIRKAKRKRKIKKITILLFLTGIIMVGIAYKSSIFLIKDLKVVGDKALTEESILSTTEPLKGENIFFISSKEITSALKTLPYVESVEVIKKYPSTVEFKVKQKQAAYYVENEGEYLVLSSDMQIIDKIYDITIPNLMELKGASIESKELGNKIKEIEEREGELLHTFYEINNVEKLEKRIDSVDVTNLNDIKVQIGEVTCLLGSDQQIVDKMEFIFDATSSKNNVISKGYIDVRTLSSPIISNN